MSRFALRISLISVLAAASAFADTMRFQPNPMNLGNLNHNNAYSWRVDDVSLLDETICDATLTISHIRNWNSSANTLYIHLLDTAKKPGVATYADDPSGVAPPTDNFLDPGLADNRLVGREQNREHSIG